jgi:hypothetical protein
LGSDSNGFYSSDDLLCRRLAANGIRLVLDELRTTETPTLKSGKPGKTKVTYGEVDDAAECRARPARGAPAPRIAPRRSHRTQEADHGFMAQARAGDSQTASANNAARPTADSCPRRSRRCCPRRGGGAGCGRGRATVWRYSLNNQLMIAHQSRVAQCLLERGTMVVWSSRADLARCGRV